MPLAVNRTTPPNPGWLDELLHVVLGYVRREDQTGVLTAAHARQALAAVPAEQLAAAGIPAAFGTPSTTTPVPGGWIDGPHYKPAGAYLTDPTWCGTEEPAHYLGHPWGLGGECWFVTAYQGHPDRPTGPGWYQHRTFAAVDPADAIGGARAWAEAGYPRGYLGGIPWG